MIQLRKSLLLSLWLLLAILSVLIIENTLPYFALHSALQNEFSVQELVVLQRDFLLDKGVLINNYLWRIAFYMHITGGLICLVTGLFQFSRYLLTHYKNVHRLFGKTYVIAVLFLAWPGGQYLSFFSKGGIWGIIPFACLGISWFYTTLKAYQLIKMKNIVAHRHWMIRSYSVAISAVTFRIYQFLFYKIFVSSLSQETNYVLSLWLSFIGNIIAAEVIIRWRKMSVS